MVNTLHIHYKTRRLMVFTKIIISFWKSQKTHKETLWSECRIFICENRWYIW